MPIGPGIGLGGTGASMCRFRYPVDELERGPAQPLEGALAAGEDDDLLLARLPVERVKHAFDAVVRPAQPHERTGVCSGREPKADVPLSPRVRPKTQSCPSRDWLSGWRQP